MTKSETISILSYCHIVSSVDVDRDHLGRGDTVALEQHLHDLLIHESIVGLSASLSVYLVLGIVTWSRPSPGYSPLSGSGRGQHFKVQIFVKELPLTTNCTHCSCEQSKTAASQLHSD